MRNRKIRNGFPQKIQDPIPMFFPSQNVLTFMLANRLVIITPRRRIQH